MRRVRVTGPARRDIANALRRSREVFGASACERYRRLFGNALRDLAEDPDRAGVRTLHEVRDGYCSYHLKSSNRAKRKAPVRRPRHLIVFRIDNSGDVIVARVFHERQLPARHFD